MSIKKRSPNKPLILEIEVGTLKGYKTEDVYLIGPLSKEEYADLTRQMIKGTFNGKDVLSEGPAKLISFTHARRMARVKKGDFIEPDEAGHLSVFPED